MAEEDIILEGLLEDEGRLVTLGEVREMLEHAQSQREELTYEQKIALEHALRFAPVDGKTTAKIVDAVKGAFPDLDEKFAYRVADLLPQHPDEVESIFLKSRTELGEEDYKKILAIVDEHYTA